MNHRHGLPLGLLLFAAAQPALGATRDAERPDKEMLRMIEFLRDMEMLKQMDLIRELDRAESLGEPARSGAAAKSAPARKKENPK